MAKVLIVEARFYDDISDELLNGAVSALAAAGHEYEVITVPGALEIPATISMAIESERYGGYVALGCVIRGETSHYDYVCAESARGINELAMVYNVAIGNGILTVENKEQAMERADRDRKDKGGFAAKACLEMIRIRKYMLGK